MKRLHYSWIICMGGMLLLICTVGFTATAFSVYLPYIIEAGDLTKTQGSTVLTVRNLVSCIALFFFDKFYQRTNMRLGMSLLGMLSAIAFMIYGLADNFLTFCLASALAGIGHGLAGTIAAAVLMDRWFKSHKALAVGLCAMGSGVASTFVPPIATMLIENFSLRTAFWTEGAIIALVSILIFAVIRNTPEEMGLTPLQTTEENTPAASTTAAAKNTNAYSKVDIFCTIGACGLIGMCTYGAQPHISVLCEEKGIDSMTISLILAIFGAMMMAGKPFYGMITDRMGSYRSSFLFFPLFMVGVLTLALANHLPAIFFGVICFGFAMPLSTVGLSVFARDISSADNYPTMLKRCQITEKIGGLLYGSVPGIIADTTGSYVPAYLLVVVFITTAMLIILPTRKRSRSDKNTTNSVQ